MTRSDRDPGSRREDVKVGRVWCDLLLEEETVYGPSVSTPETSKTVPGTVSITDLPQTTYLCTTMARVWDRRLEVDRSSSVLWTTRPAVEGSSTGPGRKRAGPPTQDWSL